MKNLTQYITESDFDKEMALWDKRANDTFGKLMHDARRLLQDYTYFYKGDFDRISTLFAEYQLDGNPRVVASGLLYYLFSYDLASFVNNKIDADNIELVNVLNQIIKVAKLKEEEVNRIWNTATN